MPFGRPGSWPGLSRFRGQRPVVDPGWGTRVRSCPRSAAGLTAGVSATTTLGTGWGQPCRNPSLCCARGAADSMHSRSREYLLEPCVSTPSDDQDAAVSDRPSNRSADPGLPSEPRVSVPHRSLERERQLITSSPSLHFHQLVALQAIQSDRSDPSSLTSAAGERDDRERRAATLKLLPHRLVAHQLPAPRTQPS
jgi:hypothetical protein